MSLGKATPLIGQRTFRRRRLCDAVLANMFFHEFKDPTGSAGT